LSLLPFYKEGAIEAGCDEAGRGCLAGSVYAAAVILPPDYKNDMLNDSKQISEKNREILRKQIEDDAISWAIGIVDCSVIDKVNILNASILAMHCAIVQLNVKPNFLLIDGNRFKPYNKIQHECIVKGDSKYMSIAAASILAKTHRDEYMNILHNEFPKYKWNKNKAYPTSDHRNAIAKYGITPYHRKSFNLNQQLKIDFGEF
jgi:ribonuclease HII